MKNKIKTIIYYISKFSKRDSNRIVFGSWFGERLSDNSFSIYKEYIRSNKNKKLIWIGNKHLKEEFISQFGNEKNVIFLKRNSLRAYFEILRSSLFFVNHGYSDIGTFNLTNGGKVVQLWHGYPIKRIVADSIISEEKEKYIFDQYDFFICSSSEEKKRFLSAFRNKGISEEKTVLVGKPRNDELFIDSKKETIRKKLDIQNCWKIVTYIPTFRNDGSFFSFANLDEVLKQFLRDNKIIILEKQHFATKNVSEFFNTDDTVRIIQDIEVQDLLTISDLLITDFSSVFADFCLLDKPIIHFLFDGKKYLKNDRGLYESLGLDFCGPIVSSPEELIKDYLLNELTMDTFKEIRRQRNFKFNEYNTANNSLACITEIEDRIKNDEKIK